MNKAVFTSKVPLVASVSGKKMRHAFLPKENNCHVFLLHNRLHKVDTEL